MSQAESDASHSAGPGPAGTPVHPRTLALSLVALGIVFGDIGTSPLYAVKECFAAPHGGGAPHGVAVNAANVLGVLSLIIWSLILVVCVKYIVFIMRADNRGEGGILALLSLLTNPAADRKRGGRVSFVAILGLFGASLLFGESVITPAISVIGAVEGIAVATPTLKSWIVPISVVILIALFAVQSKGTAKIGAVFGPVMLVWFSTLAVLGTVAIIREPQVLAAFDPRHAAAFLLEHGVRGFLTLGSVVLVVTGSEALYADMGHFGVRPIRLSWFSVVLVALVLNYLGQGAILLHDPASAANPFYALAPSWALYPMIALATAAAVIASQALISGMFSLTVQAVQLGFSPRLQVEHTSASHMGQIFVSSINWTMMLGSIGLAIGFGSSSALAAAYGIAVTGTMAITSVLFGIVAWTRWKWAPWRVVGLVTAFLIIDLAFLFANVAKIAHGGWFPLVVGGFLFTLMITWKRGRALVGERLRKSVRPLSVFMKAIAYDPPTRVAGTAIFMTGNVEGVPLALLHNLLHNKVLHRRVILLSMQFEQRPHVPEAERLDYAELDHGFHRIVARYGYMEEPDVNEVLARAEALGIKVKASESTFFLGRESLIPRRGKKGFALWRQRLFAFMARNAQPAVNYFRIPPHRVIEVGQQIEL